MNYVHRAATLPAGITAWTVGAFLRWERGQQSYLEFDGTGPVALNGGSLRHTRIALSMATALDQRLDFSKHEVVCGDAKIIANGHVRYPDVVVFEHTDDLGSDVALTPVIVVEVLSRSTQRVDQFDKNVDYAATPSILHYVMLSQARRYAIVCSRGHNGWAAQEADGFGPLMLSAIGAEIPFDEIYRRITFDDGFF